MKKAIVLFGHGARDPQWADPMRRLQRILMERLPNHPVKLAFLELMEPSLPVCVNDLVAQAVTHVQVVPIFFGQGGHLKHDFPLILAELKGRHPHLHLEATAAVGLWDAVWMAIAEEIMELMGQN